MSNEHRFQHIPAEHVPGACGNSSDRTLESLAFDNTYSRLPAAFHSRLSPTPFTAAQRLVAFSSSAARLLDLDPRQARHPQFVDYFSGVKTLPGSEPLAALYAGHQFGHYVPQLGDGRALLLGEVRNSRGEKWDLQLKGCGPTPYSRSGDGRAVLRSCIREYLCSEAMHGLGIPTTRALCVIGSDEEVYREEVESGAMLVRLSPSHVRFGSFEVFYYRDQHEHIRTLADYVIRQHYPEIGGTENAYESLLHEVVLRTARLIAKWQAVGFAHGVMNTDNMSILGLTLDYGPFGFLDHYDAGFVCNHSDHRGRYAFDQQPQIGLWNLSCLAQALTPLVSVEQARNALEHYEPIYVQHYLELMCDKLGLRDQPSRETVELVTDLLDLLQANQVDYTNFFRTLADTGADDDRSRVALRDRFLDREAFDAWFRRYSEILRREGEPDQSRIARMRAVNPKYILRNYLAEQAIRQATATGDFSEVDRLKRLLSDPFAEQPGFEHYAADAPDWSRSIQISCSS